jgi:phosphoribosylamine--glycine ligase
MRILIVGSGAREHALGWALTRDDPEAEIIAAPGNPGIAEVARCVAVAATDVEGMVALAQAERPDFTLVGPEMPLAAGIVDRFRERGLAIFGPTKAAAAIETSKVFAKELMIDASVPTARGERHVDPARAKRAVRGFGYPVVIKASGLAAGKGVIIAETAREADDAIDRMLTAGAFGEAGSEILLEEFMAGEEASMFGITDGEHVVPLVAAQDHKRLLDGDRGPNTGGMGAYAPLTLDTAQIVDDIMAPTLAALRDRGRPFTGLLYAGLMLTPTGAKVVEFNCRFGDPETEAILPITRSGLADLLHAVAVGDSLPRTTLGELPHTQAVTTVVAAANYPARPRTGDVITVPEIPRDVHVFHAGTARAPTGDLITAGGRVFAVTAIARDLGAAQRQSVAVADSIRFAGKQYRADIAWRALARHAASPPPHARAP